MILLVTAADYTDNIDTIFNYTIDCTDRTDNNSKCYRLHRWVYVLLTTIDYMDRTDTIGKCYRLHK